MKNEKGFTLLEMLLVLMIVLLIGSVSSTFSIKMTEKMLVDQFFHQLKLDIQMAQMWAMEHQKSCFVSFSSSNTYKVHHQLDEVILERKLPDTISIDPDSNLLTLRIGADGSVDNFGTITFQTGLGTKYIIVNIDKGRIRYVE
ncbi:competence type IV pilus minor pilin ComGD [Ureibacillus sp. FSL K6-8385]|uniref:Prepilin-type N-terminal cleavage/methylation domain-containing protein n=1 Tax=Ureibacillus terrenus TaxID=118246 RepID=A0A540V680_9BACL|nr:competence type IV pilus minor pilin ComGD [Ureibacillus terrenus]MED3660741.1 competence type IV pilus minor pilin ComGD [Ureibacillus terrenus]MED3762928.1 competence type IV pilus minor pilin ComGD [Ureibacillus terrenus]TQE92270.1 prepilin-type N-terminal cleavage/methylation domain-containing protein [Ureibacillus terrenus]